MSEWISVDDRLPETDGKYQTRSAYYDDGRVMRFVLDDEQFPNCKNVWYADKTSPTSSVTHWQLPEPPTGDLIESNIRALKEGEMR